MLTTAVALNAVCLLVVAVFLRRLGRPAAPTGAGEEFATILETEQVAGGDQAPIASSPAVPLAIQSLGRCEDVEGAQMPPQLALSKRLAIVRHMLQGRSAEETASVTGVEAAAARAIYRWHRRNEGEGC